MVVFGYSSQTLAINKENHWLTKPSKNSIALTFDDGPDPRYTPDILKILKDNSIKATFFVTGEKAKRYPHLIEAIHQQGHVIANHTVNHPMLTRLSSNKINYEIAETNRRVEKIIHVKPRCLRPPFGKYNARVIQIANKNGLTVTNWDLNSFDYNRRGVNQLVNWVLNQSHPGYVILLHDGGGNRSQTVKALPRIIQGFKDRGIGFEAVCGDGRKR